MANRAGCTRQHATRAPRPGSEQQKAAKLYEQFHGCPSHEVIEVIEAYGAKPEVVERVKGLIPPEDFAKLGDLVKLIIGKGRAGTEIEFDKEKERPILASNPDGTQMYIIAGNQDVSALLPSRGGDVLVDLGELVQIEYLARKRMDKFQPVIYYHELGEETGECPRLLFDRERKRLYIVGGNYKVKPEGITN